MDSSALYVYVVIFLLIIATGLGFPMPEELPIVAAGVMVGHASSNPDLPLLGASAGDTPLRWWIMLPVCIIAVVIGDSFLYGMGRWWGPKLLEKKWVQRLITPEKREKIEGNFQKYGVMVLLFARFLPTIRSPIFIMAGVTRLPYSHFVFADGLYAIPGVTLLFTLAFWFGDQFRDLVVVLEGKIDALRPVIILLVLTAIASWLIYHFVTHPFATGDPDKEMPIVGERIVKMKHEFDSTIGRRVGKEFKEGHEADAETAKEGDADAQPPPEPGGDGPPVDAKPANGDGVLEEQKDKEPRADATPPGESPS